MKDLIQIKDVYLEILKEYSDESLEESSKDTIEAYGVKGMKSVGWRKSFKNAEALNKWCEDNDADVLGQRDLETNHETPDESLEEAFVNGKSYTLIQIIKDANLQSEGTALVGEIGDSSIIIDGDEMSIYPKDDDTKKVIYRLSRVKE